MATDLALWDEATSTESEDNFAVSDGWHASSWELMQGLDVQEVWQGRGVVEQWQAVLDERRCG